MKPKKAEKDSGVRMIAPKYIQPAGKKSIKKVDSFQTSDGRIFPEEDKALAHQAELDHLKETSHLFPWEYCECGCKGSELRVGDRTFWCTVNFSGERDEKEDWYLGEGTSYASSKHIAHGMKSAREVDLKLLPIVEKTIMEILPGLLDLRQRINKYKKERND